MDLLSHADISIAGPLSVFELFMMYWRVDLSWANSCEGEIIVVAVADFIWTIGAFGAV